MAEAILYETKAFQPRAETKAQIIHTPAPLPKAQKPDGLKTFDIVTWDEITFELNEEFLIDGIMPRQGVGLLYGASQTYKSFISIHMALCSARGESWAGRKSEKVAVVYLAAEGAAGIRKRRQGYVSTGRAPAQGVDFALISAAPNLGTANGDYDRLAQTITNAGINPGMVVIDTIAKAIGGADENGAGMSAFLVNAQALAQQFNCFVLCVHHVGHDTEKQDRPRGWSGLPAALDLLMLSERKPGEMSATVTIQKLKDEPSGVKFAARMERVVLGMSATGREVSTLIVDEVSETEAIQAAKAKTVPRSQRLLRDMLNRALDESGESVKPFADGPPVKAVDAERVRSLYYAAIAEEANADEDERRLADRQRKAFNRTLEVALKAKDVLARQIAGRRMLWFP